MKMKMKMMRSLFMTKTYVTLESGYNWEPNYPYTCYDGIITSEKQLSPSERRRLKALWEYKTANINHAEAQVLEREIDEEINNPYIYKE